MNRALAISTAVLGALSCVEAWSSTMPRRASCRGSLMMSTPLTIVGANGRVGDLLASVGGGKDTLVGRDDEIPESGEGPILVCTRNDVLDQVIEKTPPSRREDLVFLQNGYLEPYLESKGLQDNTQALIYFAVSKKGEKPIDGITKLNPDGLTVTTGKWGEVVAERIQQAGMSCRVVDAADYRKAMFEKLIWICAFMLVGAVNGGITVGEALETRTAAVVDLIVEMSDAVTKTTGVEFDEGSPQRLCAYAQSVSHFPTAIKEFEWRNGFFWDISELAEDEEQPDPCPFHTSLCNQGLVEDMFSF